MAPIVTTTARILLAVELLLPPDLRGWMQGKIFGSVLVDPFFTLQHVREAAAVRRIWGSDHRFVDAYAADSIRLPPLLLAFLEAAVNRIDPLLRTIVVCLLLTVIDFYIAKCLERIARAILLGRRTEDDDKWEESLQQSMSEKIRPDMAHIFPTMTEAGKASTEARGTGLDNPLVRMGEIPRLTAQLYYCSPITILASSALGCFQNVRILLFLGAVVEVCDAGSVTVAAFFLSLATYMDVHVAVFLVPLALLWGRQKGCSSAALVILFTVFSALLQGLAYMLVRDPARYLSILSATHLHSFQLTRLAPSLSILWYFSMELFQRFRVYFTCLLGGLPYLLILPTTIRLYRYPAALVSERRERVGTRSL
jgi:hypothetical protein